jgi:Tol biopolymer transport system component/predicted Ser/Thr protein kinase
MHVTAGTRLGPYEISSRLGAGGMGEVWRARDTRLDRSVAIKILPAELAQHAQLRLRFEREARAISQLNHPNICTLYDVGDNYLVMELLEGETLADRIDRGALPLPEVLKYGVEIAEALGRAHRAGIVHRDLKPGNVMITKSGAKLLDFGLARNEVQSPAIDLEGATQQKSLTEEGTILGTFQYMAPEQLEAQPADARTDLFAFGCVMYEMLTGRRAFAGKTRTSLIAAIVSGQPQPLSAVQPLTPPALEHVIQKCLEKDPEERWQSAHDVAEELRWIARESERGDAVRRKERKAPWAVVAIVSLIALAASALYVRERFRPPDPVAFTITPPQGHSLLYGAISPDGTTMAFVTADTATSRTQVLWLRAVGELEPRRRLAGDIWKPFWSPDGKWIAYFSPEGLKRIAVSGGEPEKLTGDVSYGVGAAWSEDGTILFAKQFSEGLFRVPASGGEPVAVTKLDAKRRETLHGWPQFLPDGRHFLFIVHTIGSQQNEIHAGSFDGTHHMLLRADSLVGYAHGSLIFTRDGAMYAQAFDEDDLGLEGEPRRIAENVTFSEDSAHSYASVSRDGALFYSPMPSMRITSAWHDRGGRVVAPAIDGENITGWRLYRDASKLVMLKFDPKKGANDVYTYDIARAVATRVTGGPSHHGSIEWSAAGDRVYFSSDRDGMYDLYSQVEDGTAPAQPLWQSGVDKHVLDVSPDGRHLLASAYTPALRTDIWLVPTNPAEGKPRVLISSEASESEAQFSPDGRWIVYSADRSGRTETYVRRFPEGRSVQVSTSGGRAPQWTHDGKEVVYWSEANDVTATPIAIEGDVARPGAAKVLFRADVTIAGTLLSPTDDRILVRRLLDGMERAKIGMFVRKEWWD